MGDFDYYINMIKKIIYSFIVFILSFILSFTGPLRFLELKLIDSRFRVRGIKPAPEDIVIVEIDETTYKALGIRFPYPRDYYAKFLRNLKKFQYQNFSEKIKHS